MRVGGTARARSSNFQTTDWSAVVLPAGRGSDNALARLCSIYWYPVYAFYRRSCSAQDAHDLCQGFFARLIDKGDLISAEPGHGRFRSWLLAAAGNFRSNAFQHDRALKRGGGEKPLSIDAVHAEHRYKFEAVERLTPERAYERSWALTVIEQSLERLGEEYRARGQQALFEELKHCLAGCNEAGYRQIAQELGMDEGAFRQHVHRCKRRFRAAFDATIATTLASDEDLEEERRFVRDVLASS